MQSKPGDHWQELAQISTQPCNSKVVNDSPTMYVCQYKLGPYGFHCGLVPTHYGLWSGGNSCQWVPSCWSHHLSFPTSSNALPWQHDTDSKATPGLATCGPLSITLFKDPITHEPLDTWKLSHYTQHQIDSSHGSLPSGMSSVWLAQRWYRCLVQDIAAGRSFLCGEEMASLWSGSGKCQWANPKGMLGGDVIWVGENNFTPAMSWCGTNGQRIVHGQGRMDSCSHYPSTACWQTTVDKSSCEPLNSS